MSSKHRAASSGRGAACVSLAALCLWPLAAAAQARKPETLNSGTFAMQLPLGLPADAAYIPGYNGITMEKAQLGELLYFDPRLSKDRTISCASCHNPYHGFADAAPTSEGVGGSRGARNSPTLINRLFSKEQFWDGRAADLEQQVQGPLTDPAEMKMGSHDDVVAAVTAIKGYAPLFEKAFGSREITMPRIAQAIATYERTVVSGDSPFDRYMAGDKGAMSAAQVRGMELFNGRASCKVCHTGFNFSDESYHNLGVGTDGKDPDPGRFKISKAQSEKGAYKTPTLRNVDQTAPYMHDGSEVTLTQVVELYNRGGVKNGWLSKDIRPLHLSPQEVQDIVAFLHALTGEVTNAEPPTELPN